MGFFSKFGEGWHLFKDALSFIFRRPLFLIPIFIAWIIYSAVILYIRYLWNPSGDTWFILGELFMFLLVITYSICLANTLMLELLKQIEDNGAVSFLRALKKTIFNDALKALPIAFLWAILWFILALIQILTSRRSQHSRSQASLQDAALTLGGANSGSLSWSRLGIDLLEKVLRIVSFLALPPIVWEGKGPLQSLKESIQIIRRHPIQFLASYTLTSLATTLMLLPLIPIYAAVKEHVQLPGIIWTLVILYMGIVWSLSIYLEQMSVGLLYLWHLKWVQTGGTGDLSDVASPQLLNDILKGTNMKQ